VTHWIILASAFAFSLLVGTACLLYAAYEAHSMAQSTLGPGKSTRELVSQLRCDHRWIRYCPANCDLENDQACSRCLSACLRCSLTRPNTKLTVHDWNNIIAASIHQE